MKPTTFEHNDNSMYFAYHRVREGPNYFVCYYKHSSCLRQDPKDAWRVLGTAKFTDTGKALKQWAMDLHEQYGEEKKEARADTSFASEVQQEEPNDNTRMVT